MNKKQLIIEAADRLNATHVEIERIYNEIETIIFEQLKKGEKVSISGFGTFSIQHKDAKEIINKFSHKPMIVQEKNEPKFKFSKVAKTRFN